MPDIEALVSHKRSNKLTRDFQISTKNFDNPKNNLLYSAIIYQDSDYILMYPTINLKIIDNKL